MTLRTGGHIRVNLLFGKAGERAQRRLDAAAAGIGLVSVGFLSWSMARFTWASFAAGQTSVSSGTLLRVPQLAITLGIALLALQMLARLIQALVGLPIESARMKPAASLE